MISLAVIGSLLVLLGGGCAFAISRLNDLDFGGAEPRVHLQPIAVPHKVCPYVRVMHSAANDFQLVNPFANLPASVSQSSWARQRAQLQQSLNVLEFSVVASKGQFPTPIQRRFGVVLTTIRLGRDQVGASTDILALMQRASDAFNTGQVAFGEASDLIGNECGVHLAADPV